MRRDLEEPVGEIFDEIERRFADIALVSISIRLEPLPVVVGVQVFEEGKRLVGEVTGHGLKISDETDVREGAHPTAGCWGRIRIYKGAPPAGAVRPVEVAQGRRTLKERS
jgi:hypothetical protein